MNNPSRQSRDSWVDLVYSQKVCNGGFAFDIERSRLRMTVREGEPVLMDKSVTTSVAKGGFRNPSIACNLCDDSTLQKGHGEIVQDVVHFVVYVNVVSPFHKALESRNHRQCETADIG
jgi:hypothetical protein